MINITHVNNKIKVAIAETEMLKIAINEDWQSDEEVFEKLDGIIRTLQSVVEENKTLSLDLKLLAQKFQQNINIIIYI